MRRVTIDRWLAEMNEAAARDDAVTVAKLARWIKEKIELELEWQREDRTERSTLMRRVSVTKSSLVMLGAPKPQASHYD